MKWEVKKLGEVCKIIKDKPEEFSGKKKYYTTKAINNARDYNPVLVDFKNRPGRANIVSSVNDVGFALMNGTNKVFFIDKEMSEGIFSTGFCILRSKGMVLPKFLYIYISSDNFQKIKDYLAGKGIMGGIKKSDVEQIEILIPPLPIQKQIVAILDKSFEKISKAKDNAEKNLKNAKEIFESYLQNIFETKCEGWEEKKLGEIGITQTGTTPKTSNKENYGNYIPFITPADVDIFGDGVIRYRDEGLSEVGLKNGRKILADSILMVCIGATIGKVGFTEHDVSCNQQINSLTVKKEFYPKFFYYALSTKSFFEQVMKNASQATLPIINKSKWENLNVNFPKSISEQKSIVTKLDSLSAETKKLERIYQQKLNDLEELKKAILQKAFNGELTKD